MSEPLDFIFDMLPDGKVLVVGKNGSIGFCDKCDPTSARSRTYLLKSAHEKFPSLNVDDLEREILKYAQPQPKQNNDVGGPDDPSAAGDEALAEMPEDIRAEGSAMLRSPDLVRQVLCDIKDIGVVGEVTLSLTIFLLATSRLLRKPISGITQGASSSGKSHVADRVAALIPPEAKVMATTLTPNALYYLAEGSLRHRVVFAGERSRLQDDERAEATRALREMLSSGWLRKALPIKLPGGGFQTQIIEQEGPISLIESTTVSTIFGEDANRCLLLSSDDSAEQTRRILDAIGAGYTHPRSSSDFERIAAKHHAAQRLLRRVVVAVPFAPALMMAMPTAKTEVRRAAHQALALVQAIALLHQFQRHENPQHGTEILATVDDYRFARQLLLEPLGRSLGGSLPGGVASFAEWLRATIQTGTTFTTADLMAKDGCRWERTVIFDYVAALRDAGAVVTDGMVGKANLYRVVGQGPIGGAAWLPDPSALEGV